MESPISSAELALSAQLSPAERLREAVSWNKFASEVAIAGERARRAQHPATRRDED